MNVFTCVVLRAIYLEIMADLSAEEFLFAVTPFYIKKWKTGQCHIGKFTLVQSCRVRHRHFIGKRYYKSINSIIYCGTRNQMVINIRIIDVDGATILLSTKRTINPSLKLICPLEIGTTNMNNTECEGNNSILRKYNNGNTTKHAKVNEKEK